MSRTEDLLFHVGQRLFWGIQGGVLALCLMQLRGAPVSGPTVVPPPAVHVHLEPPSATVATAPVAIPVVMPTAVPVVGGGRLLTVSERKACLVARDAGGVSADDLSTPVRYLDRELVHRAMEDQAGLMRSARIVPEMRDGVVVGIRLFGIRPGSLAWKLGFENGDLLRSINGDDISQPEQALRAYAKLREASDLYVLLERHGVPMTLLLRVC
jgi:membrane-associated protease RseP (regulator of RpoE activity)